MGQVSASCARVAKDSVRYNGPNSLTAVLRGRKEVLMTHACPSYSPDIRSTAVVSRVREVCR